ncbi:hypothetical protein GE061_006846 [Apolygus lucorum]|uniref:Uncharacterized protein n=1 Tax=Apolygus lucorum TaxID=248454 RepID=A0A8S9WQ98_APOLU|nr:hypothetical protein GE061_006846 [Apolygus lucorum]
MEYQYSGPGDGVTSEREDLGEPCRVGTVVTSERRKPVVTNVHSCTSATATVFPSTSLDVSGVPAPLIEEVEDHFPPTETRGEVDVCPVPATPTAAPAATETSLPAVLTTDLATPTAATVATPSLLSEIPLEVPATPTAIPATPTEVPATPTEASPVVAEWDVEESAPPATNATLLSATTATLCPTAPAAMPLAEEVLQPLERPQAKPSSPAAPSAARESVIAQSGVPDESFLDTNGDQAAPCSEETPNFPEDKAEDEDLYEDDDIEHRTESDTTRIEPDTSGDLTPESLTDDCPSDDEDEKFADALSNSIDEMPDGSSTERDTQPTPPADGTHGDSPMSDGSTHAIVDTATPQAMATPRTPMSLQRTEQVEDMEEDPPIDEFVQQIYDTFQEETDAYGTISKEHVTTPEPCNAPEKTLAGIVDCIRYAANGHSYMTRTANSQAAIVAMLKVTRWIPQYQRIALERDRLLERREKWRTERDKLLKDRAEAWKEIQELKRQLGLQSVEPPAAMTTNASSKVKPRTLNKQPRAETPATSESLDESPTRPQVPRRKPSKPESPKPSTSRARSPTPEQRPRQSPTRPIYKISISG